MGVGVTRASVVWVWVWHPPPHTYVQRERELKLQRKHLEQQLAMLEAGPTGLPPLELEYKGEGLGVGQETDSDG